MKNYRVWAIASSVLAVLQLSIGLVMAQGISTQPEPMPVLPANYVRTHYTKRVCQIPMRDGVKLYTVVYEPKDHSTQHPVLMNRTPYGVGPYEKDSLKPFLGPNPYTVLANYIFVYQDVRGKYMSEGEFKDMRPYRGPHNHELEIKAAKKHPEKALTDENTDTYDSIDWLLKNVKNHNGKVGIWGISYPGFYASMALPDAHPGLKAVSPQAPIVDWWKGDDFRRNGIFLTSHAFNFFSFFGVPRPAPTPEKEQSFQHPTPDGYQFFLQAGSSDALGKSYFKKPVAFWQDLALREDLDTFWQARATYNHFKNVKPATLTVGGFYDTENLYGALQLYQSLKRLSPSEHHYLILGPWWHGQWGRDSGNHIANIRFGMPTSHWYQQKVEYPFFKHYLESNQPGRAPLNAVHVFDDGTNQWRLHNTWPEHNSAKGNPVKTVTFHPTEGGLLNRGQPATIGSVTYHADPDHPVPYTPLISPYLEKSYMIEDQRTNAQRPDVVSFTTRPLTQPLTVAGKAQVRLKLRSTAQDADFFVKVIDVHPDQPEQGTRFAPAKGNYNPAGYQQLIRWDAMRARYRKNPSQPVPIGQDEEIELVIPLNDINHTFGKGHKLMLQVHSSWFPICERHPQRYIPVATAAPDSYTPADHTLILPGCSLTVDVEE